MKQSIFALALLIGLSSSNLAWCESKAFQVGFTIPVILGVNTPLPDSNQSKDQATQTEHVIRDHRMIAMTTVVEP